MKHSPPFVDVFPYWKQMISIAFLKLLKWPSSAELWWHSPRFQGPLGPCRNRAPEPVHPLRLEFLKPQNVVLWHERGHGTAVSPVFLDHNFWGTGHQQEIDDAERAARGYQWLGPAFQWKLWSSEVVHFHEKRMEELFPQWIRNPQTFQAPKVEVLTYISCM